ncbi:hypothetical protein ACIBQX_11070 [Nonomuraea sp. NPDC049714]
MAAARTVTPTVALATPSELANPSVTPPHECSPTTATYELASGGG